MRKIYKEKITFIYIAYAFAAIYYQILYLVTPVYVRIDAYLSWLSPALTLVGIGLLLFDAVTKQNYWDRKYAALLLILLAVMSISSASWIKRGGISRNAQTILEQAVQMLVLFPLGKRMSWDCIRRFFKALYIAVSAAWVPAMIVSFCQFVYGVSYHTAWMDQGFMYGRLSGIFTMLYFGTVFTTLLLCLSLYYMLTAKKLAARILTAVEAILCFVYILLSKTRAATLAMFAALFFCLGLYLYTRLTKKHLAGFVKICASFGGALCVSFLLFLLCQITNAELKRIPTAVMPHVQQTIVESKPLEGRHKIGLRLAYLFSPAESKPVLEPVLEEIPETVPETILETEPKPVLESVSEEIPETVPETTPGSATNGVNIQLDRRVRKDISNGRFSIWKDYLCAVTDSIHSLLLGYTPGNYMRIIRALFPDYFIVTHIRDYYPGMFANNQIYDTHSAYISLLTATGLIGTFIVLWFLLRCLIAVLRNTAGKRSYDYYFLLAAIIIILVASGFDCDLFFKYTDASMLFWLLSGILMKRVGAFGEQEFDESKQ